MSNMDTWTFKEREKSKEAEKSIVGVLRAAPDLISMKQTWWVLIGALNNIGIKNIAPILLKTVQRTGLINSITSLLSVNMGKIASNFFPSMWEVLGDREAIVDIAKNKRFTFNELKKRVFKLANALKDLGVKPGDAVAEILNTEHEFFELFYANCFLGSHVPFLNWHIDDREMAEAVNRGFPKVLVFDEEFSERIANIKDKLRTVEKFVVVGEKAPEGMLLYEDLISKSSDEMPKSDAFSLAMNPYSAGTTGIPKNVSYYDAYGYLFSNVARPPRASLKEYLKLFIIQFSFMAYWTGILDGYKDKISHNIREMSSTPLYHATGLVSLAPMMIGATQVLLRHYDAEEFLRAIEKERVIHAVVVPSELQRVLNLPDEVKRKYDMSSLYSFASMSAPCPPEVKKGINEFCRKQGAKVDVYWEGGGNAEASMPYVLSTKDYQENPKRYESAGRSGIYGYVKIGEEVDGEWHTCPPNKMGRVFYRSGASVGFRYSTADEKYEDAFKTIDGEEWMDDHLLGHMDEDGFLYLTGREKEIIIVGGVNIFPQAIENVLIKHPKVIDAALIRYPDEDLGEVPLAIVEIKKGETATEEEIIEFCRKQGLSGYNVPRRVEFATEELPRMGGKMVKRYLEKKYWEDRGITRRG